MLYNPKFKYCTIPQGITENSPEHIELMNLRKKLIGKRYLVQHLLLQYNQINSYLKCKELYKDKSPELVSYWQLKYDNSLENMKNYLSKLYKRQSLKPIHSYIAEILQSYSK